MLLCADMDELECKPQSRDYRRPIHAPRPSGTLAFKKAEQKRLKMISNTASLGGLAT